MRAVRAGVVAAALGGVLAGGIATAGPAAAVQTIGYYGSEAACKTAGEQGLGTVWGWYWCTPSGSVWALIAPGIG